MYILQKDKVFYILNIFFNKLQIFTERSRYKRSSPTKSGFWTFAQSIQAVHSCRPAANRRRNCGSGKGKEESWRLPVSSDLRLPVSNLHDSLQIPCSKWTKLAFNYHKQPACKHNEKHSIAWCSENINAWCFSFWVFLNFIICMISVFKFLFVSSNLKTYYYFLRMSRSQMTFFKKYEKQRLKKS